MTRLLEKLVAQAAALPPAQQDELAARWIEELQDDARWDESFARSQDALSKLAHDVRTKIRAGDVEKTEIDEL
jgi:hypothetical protein